MNKIRLGKTELMVSASAFGALPIQRVSFDEAKLILQKAYDNGINFFDTANAYSDSEEKIGYSLSDVRHNIIIATKSGASDKKTLLEHIQLSLKRMKTDYIDLLQLHNPATLPNPDDPDSLYGGLIEAQKKGWIRFIGITNHRLGVAEQAVLSDKYDTLQFPFSSLASEKEISLSKLANEHDMGFIAMKGLSGGLITNAATTFSFIKQYNYVVPIWGIQREKELDEFIELEKNPPAYDEKMKALIQKDRDELIGNFCRGCGYCQPCPKNIEIPTVARMSLLLRRSPYKQWLTDDNREMMLKINECIECNSCSKKCPYSLETPKLIKENLKDYLEFYEAHK